MKKGCRSTSDRISQLPDNIIENILKFLPIKDAVRTSTLSSRWRHQWTTLSQLVFDKSFSEDFVIDNMVVIREMMMTIFQVLLHHEGPITHFTLSIPKLRSCPEMDQIMLHLSKKGSLQDLTLRIWIGDQHKMPSYLFTCLQLTHLDLCNCAFKAPSSFKGFSKLDTLLLTEVGVAADFFQTFVPKCPLLKELCLSTRTEFQCLQIEAPNLRTLDFQGVFKAISFKNTPLLAQVSIESLENRLVEYFEIHRNPSNMTEIFASLPAVEKISVGYNLLREFVGRDIPKTIPTTLEHLKVLELFEFCFGNTDEVSVLFCLLSSSPNLNRLSIQAQSSSGSSNTVLYISEEYDHWDVSFRSLKEVRILSMAGVRPELDFIQFLLARAPVLQRLYIQPYVGFGGDRLGLEILRKVAQFPRVSEAGVIYMDPTEDEDTLRFS